MALLGALAVAGFLAALAWLPRSYQAQASIALVPSLAAVAGGDSHAYPGLAPSVGRAAASAGREVASARVARRLASRGFTDSYSVGWYLDSASSALLVVTVGGSDSARVGRTLRAVVGQVDAALGQTLGRALVGGQVTATSLVTPTQPAPPLSQPGARPLVVVVVFVVVIVLGCPVVLDARLGRRRSWPEPTTG